MCTPSPKGWCHCAESQLRAHRGCIVQRGRAELLAFPAMPAQVQSGQVYEVGGQVRPGQARTLVSLARAGVSRPPPSGWMDDGRRRHHHHHHDWANTLARSAHHPTAHRSPCFGTLAPATTSEAARFHTDGCLGPPGLGSKPQREPREHPSTPCVRRNTHRLSLPSSTASTSSTPTASVPVSQVPCQAFSPPSPLRARARPPHRMEASSKPR